MVSKSNKEQNRYDKSNVHTMERVYGTGYLSAGGDSEVARIIDGLDLTNLSILDLGCGLGGAVITMAQDHNAGHVTGVDIDKRVLDRAKQLVDMAGVESKTTLRQIQSGPLPFEEHTFDIVYTNAVSCHIEQLPPFFSEIERVLRPGGWLVGNEWYKLNHNQAFKHWDDLLRRRGLNFYFVSQEKYRSSIEQSSLEFVNFHDRTENFLRISLESLQRVENELKDEFLALLGETGYQEFVEWAKVRVNSMAEGGMQQGHFRARKSED